jgi:hypothetical protein
MECSTRIALPQPSQMNLTAAFPPRRSFQLLPLLHPLLFRCFAMCEFSEVPQRLNKLQSDLGRIPLDLPGVEGDLAELGGELWFPNPLKLAVLTPKAGKGAGKGAATGFRAAARRFAGAFSLSLPSPAGCSQTAYL